MGGASCCMILMITSLLPLIPPEIEEEVEQQINLAAERQNPIISWDEFAGYYS